VAVSYVLLKVGNAQALASMREWYVRHLSMTVVREERGTSCFLSTGRGAVLALHLGDPVDHPERVALYMEVDDVDELYRRLSGAGLTFDRTPVTKQDWEGRVMSLRDPVGYLVKPYQVVQRGATSWPQ